MLSCQRFKSFANEGRGAFEGVEKGEIRRKLRLRKKEKKFLWGKEMKEKKGEKKGKNFRRNQTFHRHIFLLFPPNVFSSNVDKSKSTNEEKDFLSSLLLQHSSTKDIYSQFQSCQIHRGRLTFFLPLYLHTIILFAPLCTYVTS